LTLLTLLPALLLSMTPLVRLLVVFHFLRQALGTQTAPSNQVLMGLALMMTWFLMQPVLVEVEQHAVAPYRAGSISGEDAIHLGMQPVKRYMLRYAREKDLSVFAAAGMVSKPKTKDDLPLQVVIPAYILSELKAGFQIGAILFFPFLLLDLVVASVTTSIGMMQLPPVVISTPLKILLFVMVDGWNLLATQLIKSFYKCKSRRSNGTRSSCRNNSTCTDGGNDCERSTAFGHLRCESWCESGADVNQHSGTDSFYGAAVGRGVRRCNDRVALDGTSAREPHVAAAE